MNSVRFDEPFHSAIVAVVVGMAVTGARKVEPFPFTARKRTPEAARTDLMP